MGRLTPRQEATMDWVDRLAEALGEEPLSGREVDGLLRSSREVAHRVERRATPLTAYLVGLAVARGVAQGSPREAALGDALEAVLARLPDAVPGGPTEAPGDAPEIPGEP